MNILFYSFYEHVAKNMDKDSEDLSYGNNLLYPFYLMCGKLKSAGHNLYFEQPQNIQDIDIAIFIDIDARLFEIAKNLPFKINKVLICIESPIYCPIAHSLIIFDDLWTKVLTYNRGFSSNNIIHFDIPFVGNISGLDFLETMNHPKKHKGIVISSFKKDYRGYLTSRRDKLLKTLAQLGEIDLYGHGWQSGINIIGKTENKIETLNKYHFTLIIENAIYPGYVTEKIADAILAGLPSIYYGDFETAERRFSGSFVQLENISVEAFIEAKEELNLNYDKLIKNVEDCFHDSNNWTSSFINQLFRIIDEIQSGIN